MKTLFGISMDTIMAVTLALVVLVTVVVALLALRNRLLLKLGLRNIPRRRAQTLLIVFGLMLSSIIVTSAFSTGDTISYSIRSLAVSGLGAIDEIVSASQSAQGSANGARGSAGAAYFPVSVIDRVRKAINSQDVDGIVGVIAQPAPLQDSTSHQTKANTLLVGLPSNYPPAFGPLTALDGTTVSLSQLAPGQVYLSELTGHDINAHDGDTIMLYLNNQPQQFTVRRVLRNQGLAAGGLANGDVEVLLPLSVAQNLIGQPGKISQVLISNSGDALSGVSLSDRVTTELHIPLANTAQVAVAKSLLDQPAGQAALRALRADKTIPAATQQKLASLQTELGVAGTSNRLKDLLSDNDVSSALQSIKTQAIAVPLGTALATISDFNVQTIKQQVLDTADLAGSIFTSIFIVFGLFSIAAGIMLIFLIFVMLAAERRAEMGMARAIGTKRRHLIQQFLFEGYVYDLGAALVGVALGIGVGLSMVAVMAGLFQSQTSFFTLQRHVEVRSVVVAFCLGALVTFITVVISSWRVSRLNVVAAIRDLPDDLRLGGSIGEAFRLPLTDLANVGRRLRRGRVLGALGSLLAAPWHLLIAFRVFISRGPLLLVAGYLLFAWGGSIKQLFPFDMGLALMLVGAAMMLRWILGGLGMPERSRNRLGFSLAGIALVVLFLLPFDALRSDLQFDIEMFFLAGMMLMLGGIWTVMYNIDVVLGTLLLVFGGVGRIAPVLKMAVTYPMQHRFRTGMTLFMFSLVIFALMVMSVLTASFGGTSVNLSQQFGGYDASGAINPLNPIANMPAQVAANPTLRDRVAAVGGLGQLYVRVRQAGQKDQTWQDYNANIADDAYLSSTTWTLHSRATGYTSDAQVWQALRSHPGYAVIDGDSVKRKSGGGGNFQIQSFVYEDTTFAPTIIEAQDPRTGKTLRLTVIGVLFTNAEAYGLFTGQSTLAAAQDAAVPPTDFFFRVAPGQDVHQTVLALGAAFLPHGLDLSEARVEWAKNQALGVGLYNLLEGFMALGLVVGIAALGVIATRSVVERRQQIGMLRAIGFKRSMVQTSFLMESSFVALLAALLGSVLGLLLARQLVLNFAKTQPDIHVTVPWAIVGLILAGAYIASLLTTYLPAWQASRIYPAEALRYE